MSTSDKHQKTHKTSNEQPRATQHTPIAHNINRRGDYHYTLIA